MLVIIMQKTSAIALLSIGVITGGYTATADGERVDIQQPTRVVRFNCDGCSVRVQEGITAMLQYTRTRCPATGVHVVQDGDQLEVRSNNGNTRVEYELTLPKGTKLEYFSVKAGDLDLDVSAESAKFSIDAGKVSGKVSGFFSDAQFKAGDVNSLRFSYMNLFKPASKVRVQIDAGNARNFNIDVPQGIGVYSSIQHPPVGFFGRGPVVQVDPSILSSEANAKVLLTGNFAAGNIGVEKKVPVPA